MNILCLKCTFWNLILEASHPASLCVSSPAFVLDASKKNQFLPLGKLEEALWHLWLDTGSVHCVHFCTLDTVHCAPAAVAGQQQQKTQGGGKALRCQHSTSRSSLGKRVTAALEKPANRPKEKETKSQRNQEPRSTS